ncbi:protein takeout-like isoform X1 [Homalodisca vitripennis]|uniref:protein takeout-like isoform X1 n=2 Tax=Homalodisca vitripennis TaxID=197043 RepID=UPI001EEB8671|nr:protein takeout-like isoform X1 [Homalodisca vitripennis]
MEVYRFLVVTVFAATCVPAAELPNVPKCKMSDPMLPMCFMLATDIIRPQLVAGIPERNIPPIEPLVIPMVMLQQGTSAVNYKANLKNIKVIGLGNYQFKNVVLNVPKLMAAARVEVPTIQLVSDYTIKGRALVVPIEGDGIFRANLTNVKADVMIVAALKKRKGEEFLHLKMVKSRLTVGKATANFDNLFNGDKTLSKATNDFVNQNAQDIIEEIKPAVEAVVSMLIEDIGNKVLKTTPYKSLFLPEN